MIRLRRLGITLSLFVGACAGQGVEGDPANEDRGPIGKADHNGSCQAEDGDDYCDGKSAGNCWCDELCSFYDDCCADVQDVCDDDDGDDGGDDDDDGADDGPICGDVLCALFCENGFKTDENGCEICACNEQPCGGFLGLPCPDGLVCVDFPGDSCDPNNGGADCGGICVPPPPADSCKDNCGGNAGSCWCDDACTKYGDCCDDYADACTDTGTECGEETCTAGQVCVTDVTQIGLMFECADIPAECDGNATCDCMGEDVCTGAFNFCSEDPNGLSCSCPVC